MNFTIRVYGLILNKDNEILVSDEFRFGRFMTKFPGGGLEYGESTIECLKREFKEELDNDLHEIEHFYTTDFFQCALFFENTQLISIYYIAKLKVVKPIKISEKKYDFPEIEEEQRFRWLPLYKLKEKEFSFPIDQKVAKLLKEKYI